MATEASSTHFLNCLSCSELQGAGAHPSMHLVRGRVNPAQAASIDGFLSDVIVKCVEVKNKPE